MRPALFLLLLGGCSSFGALPEPPDSDAGPPPVVDAAVPDKAHCSLGCALGTPCTTGAMCASHACSAGICSYPSSCKAALLDDPSTPSGPLTLETSGVVWETFCEMTEDGGGWALLLKQDGSAPTFAFASELWTNETLYHSSSTTMSQEEAKLAGFNVLPFTQLRIGLAELGPAAPPPKFVVVADVHASLRGAFAGPADVPFAAPKGRATWLALKSTFELPPGGCDREGYNMGGLSRLGILSSSSSACNDAVARIGLGGTGVTSAGNVCSVGCSVPNLRLPMFAFVMGR